MKKQSIWIASGALGIVGISGGLAGAVSGVDQSSGAQELLPVVEPSPSPSASPASDVIIPPISAVSVVSALSVQSLPSIESVDSPPSADSAPSSDSAPSGDSAPSAESADD